MCVFSIWLHDCFLFVHLECKSVERTGESNSNDSLYISATCNWIALVQLWNLAVCAIARMTATVTIIDPSLLNFDLSIHLFSNMYLMYYRMLMAFSHLQCEVEGGSSLA